MVWPTRIPSGADFDEFFYYLISAVDDSSCSCDCGGGDRSATCWVLSSHPVSYDLLSIFGLIDNVRIEPGTNDLSWSREVLDTTWPEASFRERLLITLLDEDNATFVFVSVVVKSTYEAFFLEYVPLFFGREDTTSDIPIVESVDGAFDFDANWFSS